MRYRWSETKERELQAKRGVSFLAIEAEIRSGGIVDIIEHPSRPNQRILLLDRAGYIWAVPFVEEDDEHMFLKTAFPSRKFTRMYGGHDERSV